MFRNAAVLTLLCLSLLAKAQNKSNTSGDKLSPGAALLFKDVKTSATTAEKNKLYKQLGLELSPDKKGFIITEYPVQTSVYPTDMNKDGQEELFIGLGSVALYGNIGESYSLYIKDKAGAFQMDPVFSGSGRPAVLSMKNLGYPDLLIGGPGFEFPVYRWNGRKYVWHRKMKDAALTNDNNTDIDQYSKAFTDSR